MTLKKKLPLEAVLFDLDGTLIDTAADFIFCINQLCAEKNIPAPNEKIFRTTISNGARAMIECAFNIEREDKKFIDLVNEFLDIYEHNVSQYSALFPSLDTLLKTLEKNKIHWGIITNKPVRFANPLIEALHLSPACLICPDHVAQRKPDPESMYLACAQLNIKAKNCLYIGDHLRDIQAGRSAKMHTLAAAYGYIDDADSAANWRADYYAVTPQKIEEIIFLHFAATN